MATATTTGGGGIGGEEKEEVNELVNRAAPLVTFNSHQEVDEAEQQHAGFEGEQQQQQ